MIAHSRVGSGLLGTMLILMLCLQDQCAIAAHMDTDKDLSFHALVALVVEEHTCKHRFVMHHCYGWFMLYS